MAVSKEDILGAIADMSVMDLVELIEAMEEKFGVTAAAAVAAAPAGFAVETLLLFLPLLLQLLVAKLLPLKNKPSLTLF